MGEAGNGGSWVGAGVQRTGAGKYKLARRGDVGVSEIETDGRGGEVSRSEVCNSESTSRYNPHICDMGREGATFYKQDST